MNCYRVLSLGFLLIAATQSDGGNCTEWSESFDSLTNAKVALTEFGGSNNVFVADYASSFFIPEAPRPVPGGSATTGLVIEVNRSSPGTVSSVNATALIAPNGPTLDLTNNYRVSFDVYMSLRIASLPYSGSTQAMLWGIGTGDTNANGRGAPTANDGVWGWLAVDGGFLSEDATFYNEDVAVQELRQQPPDESPFFSQAFGSVSPNNVPWNRWVPVDIVVENNVVDVFFSGVRFFSETATNTDGTPFLGYMDPFAGLSAVPDFQRAVFDNFRVEFVPEPNSGLLCVFLVACIAIRRSRKYLSRPGLEGEA